MALDANATSRLFKALRKSRLVCLRGELGKFRNGLVAKASARKQVLRVEFTPGKGQIESHLVSGPSATRRRGQGAKQDVVVRQRPGHRVVRGYSGTSSLPSLAPTIPLRPITPQFPTAKIARLKANPWLVGATAKAVVSLGLTQFTTGQLRLLRRGTSRPYDHWLLNRALIRLPWLEARTPKLLDTEEGAQQQWSLDENHTEFPGWPAPPSPTPSPSRALNYRAPRSAPV